MSKDERRVKLDTAIEKNIHQLIRNISEGMFDAVQLDCRKRNIPVEPEVLTHILKTAQIVISGLELQNMDAFHRNIKALLDDYAGEDEEGSLAKLSEATVLPKSRHNQKPVTPSG